MFDALVRTPAYMAPEQVEGAPVGARTDLYALGLVLYEMIVGARAWTGESPLAVAAARLGSVLEVGRHEELAQDEQHDDPGGDVKQATHGGVSLAKRRGGGAGRPSTDAAAAPRIGLPERWPSG